LIHEPDILILDEPTTGVDPLSRRRFWELIDAIREARSGLSVLVATAYMEEAAGFEWLIAMHDGRVLFTGKAEQFMAKNASPNMEQAFIEANNLTMRFGDFTAVNHVSFKIERGEIFGFLGPNGSGKTTTMKMLTGLLSPSEGEAKLFGHILNSNDLETRKHVGYMSQTFSLYTELSVKQNLILHARLFNLPEEQIQERVKHIVQRFGLEEEINRLPDSLPLGQRQRLSLAVAMIHNPKILILDEPTSGVDPIAREAFWNIMIELSRKDHVTIFISTHFMNEAERCDRISLMHAGQVLASAPPADLIKKCNAKNLEEAFITFLEQAGAHADITAEEGLTKPTEAASGLKGRDLKKKARFFNYHRLMSCIRRESLELYRDTIRLALSIIGSIILLLAFGYGISLDVNNLPFAVLDWDQTNISREYIDSIAGSHYFTERPPIKDHQDLDRRMRSGDISMALEIPSGFARDLRSGKTASIGAWVDGANPRRAEIILSYIQGMNQNWLATSAPKLGIHVPQEPIKIDTRYRYNPNVESEKAMMPAAFAVVLMMIPSMLSTLSIVREKELGSIVNLYVSPLTRLEFLVGKQIPYILLALISFFIMVVVAYLVFRVPVKGSFLALFVGTIIFVAASTAIGLLISTFTKSQTAAIFATGVLTLLPTINFSGMLDPISSLGPIGMFIGEIFPTTYYLVITRGVFLKGLGFSSLGIWFVPLLLAIVVLFGLSAAFLKKQER
jgi:ribosome-dependent ATPase